MNYELRMRKRIKNHESRIMNMKSRIRNRDSLFMIHNSSPRLRHDSLFMIHNSTRSTRRGFTLLYSVLVASLVLSIGVGIASIVLKELVLASTGRESQFAFYTADSGVECALFSDFQSAGAFATSTDSKYQNPNPCQPHTISCNGQNNITVTPVCSDVYNAVNTFTLSLAPACAAVTVTKTADALKSGASKTTIESRGQNDCAGLTNPFRVERAIRVKY